MQIRSFGTLPDGSAAEIYTLKSSAVEADIATLGATIAAVRVKNIDGTWTDVALGFDTPEEYLKCPWCLGATIGRYAGRIANGQFELNGTTWQLKKNRDTYTIHGGPVGFHQQIWNVCQAADDVLELKLISPDGDQGFPGMVTVSVAFRLEQDALTLEYRAMSDADTPFNMTNPVYWNLAGHDSGTVDEHVLMVPSKAYLETDGDKIPTGCILPLKGTELDLQIPKLVKHVHADHSFLLPDDGEMHLVGRIFEPASGRWVEVTSDLPSVQVYTADGMAVMAGKQGATYGARTGMCLEAQFYPDSPNHENFPSAILMAGEELVRRIRWQFGIKNPEEAG